MSTPNTFHQSLEYIQNKIQGLLSTISNEEINSIQSLFFDAHRIFVYGAGRSGLVARAFAIRLVHLGFQTFVIGETIGAPVKKDDLVVIVSGSGETIPAVMTAEIAHNIGAPVLVITGVSQARITRFALQTIILYGFVNESERKRLAPMGTLFEASAWIFLDALIAKLMDAKGETEENMRSRHATLE